MSNKHQMVLKAAAPETILGKCARPRPRLVCVDGRVVGDAVVVVSERDPNYPGSDGGVVRVRRSDFVTINMAVWEEQQRQKREDRRLRRALDPCRLGLYGPIDEDE